MCFVGQLCKGECEPTTRHELSRQSAMRAQDLMIHPAIMCHVNDSLCRCEGGLFDALVEPGAQLI